jgi:cytochrome c553
MASRKRLWSKIAFWTLMVVVAFGLAASAFIWSGLYNVAASRGHFPVTAMILEVAMRQSVKAHSWHLRSPPLDNPDMVRLGAGHYHGGCAPCHGAPGDPNNPIVQHMLPLPTYLPSVVHKWSPEELFWIIKNGIKYTGMPAWVAFGRDDEVWGIVAFLRQLPAIDAREYRSLAFGNADQDDREAREIVDLGSDAAAISACARCHDDEAAAPQSRLVPKLAAQSVEYLEIALKDYAAGLRQSGIMQSVAGELNDQDMVRLSSYYANLARHDPQQRSATSSLDGVDRGRMLARAGSPKIGVPPCLACHGEKSLPSYPRLAGQSREYLIGQLLLFRKGLRNQTPQGAIMTTIARRLTPRDMQDAAEFFEQLKLGATEPAAGSTP